MPIYILLDSLINIRYELNSREKTYTEILEYPIIRQKCIYVRKYKLNTGSESY
jgi:hypothetical protein